MQSKLVLAFFTCLFFTQHSTAQEQAQIVQSFERKVEFFERFFSQSPKLLEKQTYSYSPTGEIFFYHRFDDFKISYDIQKSDSLVSPYLGYITVSWWFTTSRECGEGRGSYGTERRFLTAESARKDRDNESCYKGALAYETRPIISTAKFTFAYQKGAWVFKDVVDPKDGSPEYLFWTAFGKPTRGRIPVPDNDIWKTLID